MKNILVAGGAGFIGSHLCRFLLTKNTRVVCLDNLLTSHKKNIKPLLSNPNFSFIKADVIYLPKLKIKFDQIYNLACPASPIHYQKSSLITIKSNTLGIINLLELARRNKATILQSSTSEIYGDPLQHPQTEQYNGNVNPIGPRACYDEGKRLAETLFIEYKRHYQQDIKIARIFNTYGPQMAINDGRVVSNFIVQALANKNITIYGRGQQTRSFCFVSDLINALYALMNAKNFCGPVNLGNPNELTILEIAKKIINLTNSNSKIVYLPAIADDPCQRKPDISLAKKKLHWQPTVSLETGLQQTISYFMDSI